jgi:hypothetical protein
MKITAILMIAITSTVLLAFGISTFLIVFFTFQTMDKPNFSVIKYSPLFILNSSPTNIETKNISYQPPCCNIV